MLWLSVLVRLWLQEGCQTYHKAPLSVVHGFRIIPKISAVAPLRLLATLCEESTAMSLVPRDDDAPTRQIGHRATSRVKKDDSRDKDSLPWNKEVTDAQGRRRFHGAFTGGWSAGYFNTVGSKEGWKPSQFVSSRSRRADRQKVRPEDFMDAEDLAEAAQAGKTLIMQKDFQDEDMPGDKRKPAEKQFEGMLTVNSESIGRQLLRTMGWREGKQVGDQEVSKALNRKVYGVSRPPIAGGEGAGVSTSSSSAAKTPRQFDTRTGLYQTRLKSDLRGLGYSGHNDILAPPLRLGRGNSVPFGAERSSSTSGLGLGALEAAGIHDEVYSSSNMDDYDIDIDVKGGEAAARARGRRGHGDEVGHQIAALAFVRPRKAERPPEEFKEIRVPPDFTGIHRFQHDELAQTVAEDLKRIPSAQDYLRGALHQIHQRMSIADRARALGEKKLPGPPPPKVLEEKLSREMVELISEKDRQKLAASLESAFTTSGKSLKTIDTDPDAWRRQFKEDPQKQERFERFLEVMAGKPGVKVPRHKLTNWQYQREMEEFTQIFNAKFKKLQSSQNKAQSSPAVAAKLRMYGRLTRTKEPWGPDRLLCLRFGVPDPYKDRPLPSKAQNTSSQRRYQETIDILQASQRSKSKIKGPSRLSRTNLSSLKAGRGISFVATSVSKTSS
ncbi:hypothetical protein AAMO2058_001065500 [Amorphochlora amoebiformis]